MAGTTADAAAIVMRSMANVRAPAAARFSRALGKAAIAVYVVILAWAPFPLGGALGWGAGLQEILIALCWVLWALSTWQAPVADRIAVRVLAGPLVLATLALGWACLQCLSIVPSGWAHPVWAMTSDALGTPIVGAISLNPWRTESEILKLASSVMAFGLAFNLARQVRTAKVLLSAVVLIGAGYAIYAFGLELFGRQQAELFYGFRSRESLLSGPFMLHNSYATWSGMAAVAGAALFYAHGSDSIVTTRGLRTFLRSVLQYCLADGAAPLLAWLLCMAAVIASASRAGAAATLAGLLVLVLCSLFLARRSVSRTAAGAVAILVAAPVAYFVVASGDTLSARIEDLLNTGTTEVVRLALWDSAWRMINDAPLLGLGLGTFQDAYPLYAVRALPYVMDKAHGDYLEFAAGLGLPAAAAWWLALVWLLGLCLRGLRVRRRHRVYALAAVAATTVVGVHAIVDFSLQLPAVSLLYATLLAIGVAQSFPTRHTEAHQEAPKYHSHDVY